MKFNIFCFFLLFASASLFAQKKKTIKVKVDPKIFVGPLTDTLVAGIENYITVESPKVKKASDIYISVTGATVMACPSNSSSYMLRITAINEVKIIIKYQGKEIYNKTFMPVRIPYVNPAMEQMMKRLEIGRNLSKARC